MSELTTPATASPPPSPPSATLTELRGMLPELMLHDQHRLRRHADRAARVRDAGSRDQAIARLAGDIGKARQRVEGRRQAVPVITYPDELPVSQRRDEIAAAIREHQVVIVAGETGSGKTTQLPKICLELGRGVTGQIGHTQPRRIAARTVAERIAEELSTDLGQAVGYKVRFTDKATDGTLVKLMTDGILLAEISQDRDLLRYDTLIIDEAHERSLNVDFILGYLRQLLPRRPDLKVVITSATIDPERFAAHFVGKDGNPAPIVEVSGRTYPVEVRYRPLADEGQGEDGAPDRDQVQAISDALDELLAEPSGDVLVFLSGEREIRDTADALKGRPGLDILPLYARLSSAEQHRVFELPRPSPGRVTSRRVVLATNVAETSLTVPGIRYVIDPGTARISRYSHRTKVQRLPIERISQASANQRKGRCGRVADGICIRLYSEDDFESRPEFTDPEILRTNLASVILQMAAARLGDVRAFPFVDPPDPRAIDDGVRLLEELNAFKAGRLTEAGRELARLPVDPRIARMIVEGGKNGCAREVLIIGSALSIQDPRERPADAQPQADAMHRRFAVEDSDFMAFVGLWDHLAERQRELSGNAFRRLCKAEFLNYLRVREWQDLHGQLQSLAADLGVPVRSTSTERLPVHQSLLAGLLSHIGMKIVVAPRAGSAAAASAGSRGRRPMTEYLGARGARFAIFPGSGLARKNPDWIVAAELVETSRLWGRMAAAIEPEWIEPIAQHLVRRSYSEPHWSRRRGSAVATEKVTLYGIPIVADRTVGLSPIDPAAARDLFIRHALVEGDWETRHHFFRDNQKLIAEAAELEQRARRRGLVAGEDTLHAFYDARVPADVTSARHFDAWWKKARHVTPDLLTLTMANLLSEAAADLDQGAYPEVWTSESASFATPLPVSYEFQPGSEADGVTIDIPLSRLNQARPEEFSWQVPGLREELVTELIRSLPKALRRELVPAPNVAREVLGTLGPAVPAGDVREVLPRELLRLRGVRVSPDDFDMEKLPPHLRITFRVTSEVQGGPGTSKVLAAGKDLAALQRQLRPRLRATLSARASALTRTGLTDWSFGVLPKVFTDGEVRAYPALVDTGAAVDIRLFETQEAALAAMRAGTRRLILLGARSPVKDIAARLTTQQKLLLSKNPHGGVARLFEDCVNCAADSLVADAGGPAWDEESFQRLALAVRGGLHAVTYEVVTWAETTLGLMQAIEVRLAGLRSPVLEPATADVRQQLAGLVGPGYLTKAGLRRLPSVARYLRGIERRLDKLPENPGRDAQLMAVVHGLEEEYQDALAAMPPAARGGEDAAAVRWMIEELRVSLFAQTLGTPSPVSERRVRSAIDRLRLPIRVTAIPRRVARLFGLLPMLRSLSSVTYFPRWACRPASEEERTVTRQPPIRRRLLGTALRGYRENLGYGLEDAARILACDRSKISRIETGLRGIGVAELRQLLDEYGVSSEEREALVAIAHRGHDGGWWHGYRDVLSEGAQDLAIMEGAATEILGFASQCVPDLLQTEDYARAIADADPAYSTDDQRGRAVQSKLVRQSVVLGDSRARLEVVVTEGAVRQMVGGAEVMRRQLRRLANLGDDAGTPVGDVTVQVLPFDAGAHAVTGTGAVTILRFSAVPGLGAVHIGGLNGGASLDEPQDVRRYASAFTLLRVTALSPAASVRLLREMARALPRE